MKKDGEKTGAERREYPRLSRQVSVTVKKLEYPMSNGSGETTMTRDLGQKGACFVVSELYDPGTIVNLEIGLRGWQHHLRSISSIVDADTMSKPLTVIAEVMWSKQCVDGKGYEVGVRFNDIYEDDYQAFKTYLSNIIKKLKETS